MNAWLDYKHNIEANKAIWVSRQHTNIFTSVIPFFVFPLFEVFLTSDFPFFCPNFIVIV